LCFAPSRALSFSFSFSLSSCLSLFFVSLAISFSLDRSRLLPPSFSALLSVSLYLPVCLSLLCSHSVPYPQTPTLLLFLSHTRALFSYLSSFFFPLTHTCTCAIMRCSGGSSGLSANESAPPVLPKRKSHAMDSRSAKCLCAWLGGSTAHRQVYRLADRLKLVRNLRGCLGTFLLASIPPQFLTIAEHVCSLDSIRG